MTQQEMSPRANIRQMPPPHLAKGLPLLGNIIPFVQNPVNYFVKQYRQLGPIFDIRLFRKQITVVAGPEANMFLAQKESDYLTSKNFFHDFCQEFGSKSFIFYQEADAHRFLRKVMRPGLSHGVINRYGAECVTITQEIARKWQPDQPIPVIKFMQELIGQQSGILLANCAPGNYLPDIITFLNTVTNVTILRRWPRVALHQPVYRKAKKRVMQFLREVVAVHREQKSNRPYSDYVDNILKAVDEGSPLFASENDILSAILIPYIGGVDTVAYTLAFMLYALLKHPKLLERALTEVDQAFADGVPDSYTLRKMPVLHRIFMETMRLYPVAPFVMRQATRPFTFAGHHVKQGQEIIFAITLPHFLPEFFPLPHLFDIERYIEPRNEHRQRGVFASFGLGAHTCIGAGLGEAQMMLTMSTLLHTMELALDPPHYEVKPRIDTLLSPGHQFHVKFVRWRS